jgi:prepilin-type processing-associated H-X9-DG protein
MGPAARSWVPDLLPFLEQANMVSGVNYDLSQDWWRTKSADIEDPANPGTYIPDPMPHPIPNGITAQKFLEVLICPSSAIPHRTQFKEDAAAGNKIGACGDYFTPEGVHSAILAELPTANVTTGLPNIPLGQPIPGFPAGTTASSNIVVSGVLQPWGAGSLPSWLTDVSGEVDPRLTVFRNRIVYPRLAGVTDGTSNTIMVGECAGREDVWRGRVMTAANAFRGQPNCARAQGGAWATNDNSYAIGQRKDWCSQSSDVRTIPGKMKINNSNESGHLYYSFHSGGANFGFADASVKFLDEDVALWVLASLTTRAGGEAMSDTDF